MRCVRGDKRIQLCYCLKNGFLGALSWQLARSPWSIKPALQRTVGLNRMLMTQILAELYGCDPIIEDAATLAATAKNAAQSVGATVVGECEIRYVPHGLTVIVFLGESHIILTTWPEYQLTLLDILLCNPEMDPGAVVATLKARLCPSGQMIMHEVLRRIDLKP